MKDYRIIDACIDIKFNELGGVASDAGAASPHTLGGEAALDLFIGHLPFDEGDSGFRQVSRGVGPDVDGWFVRKNSKVIDEKICIYQSGSDDYPVKRHFVLKVQPFDAGGAEYTIVSLDLEQIARSADAPKQGGKREKGVQNENDIISSVNRSKKGVRLRVKNIGADRMLTLTKRYDFSDISTIWTPEEWGTAWYKFIRLCKKNGVEFPYVAILERHKTGPFHLHAAITGNVPVKVLRAMWYKCVGCKGGNVDISFKPAKSDYERRSGLAKYLTKYMSKQIGMTEFCKKRYWHSKHKLPAVKRFILDARTVASALYETASIFGFDSSEVCKRAFQFDGLYCGAWFSFDDDLIGEVPF